MSESELLCEPFEPIDPKRVEWSRVREVAYLLQQTFRYEYEGPVEDLRQRLVVIPPERHGEQRLIDHRLEVRGGPPRLQEELDQFGNRVSKLYVPRVDEAIEFEVRFLVERSGRERMVPPEELDQRDYREPSELTVPDARLRMAATALGAGGRDDLAARVCAWVKANVVYQLGATDVTTTAAQALAIGKGVCQDHAHVMLAICRLLDLPARYVSGHLLGEGATHAWVEVLERDAVIAFDPSHGRPCRLDYITVAVGRDYQDVAPTSGSYTGPWAGMLTSRKRACITRIGYAA